MQVIHTFAYQLFAFPKQPHSHRGKNYLHKGDFNLICKMVNLKCEHFVKVQLKIYKQVGTGSCYAILLEFLFKHVSIILFFPICIFH